MNQVIERMVGGNNTSVKENGVRFWVGRERRGNSGTMTAHPLGTKPRGAIFRHGSMGETAKESLVARSFYFEYVLIGRTQDVGVSQPMLQVRGTEQRVGAVFLAD